MAVPKQKISSSRQHSRKANKSLRFTFYEECLYCQKLKKRHNICRNCQRTKKK